MGSYDRFLSQKLNLIVWQTINLPKQLAQLIDLVKFGPESVLLVYCVLDIKSDNKTDLSVQEGPEPLGISCFNCLLYNSQLG